MRTLRLWLAGMAILALLGGLGGAVLAQEQAEPIDPMAPGPFVVVEDLGDRIVATDPRFSGALIEGEFIERSYGTGNTFAGSVRVENDDGAWQGWTSGFGWADTPPVARTSVVRRRGGLRGA